MKVLKAVHCNDACERVVLVTSASVELERLFEARWLARTHSGKQLFARLFAAVMDNVCKQSSIGASLFVPSGASAICVSLLRAFPDDKQVVIPCGKAFQSCLREHPEYIPAITSMSYAIPTFDALSSSAVAVDKGVNVFTDVLKQLRFMKVPPGVTFTWPGKPSWLN